MMHRALTTLIIWLPLAHVVMAFSCFIYYCSASSSPQPAVSFLTSPWMGNSSDEMALLSFKSSLTSDPHGALVSWNERLHFCRWKGVMCGRRHPDRVTALHLRSLGLSGAIPTAVANLTFLRRLDLFNNSFHGHIPEGFGRLLRLRYLDLAHNSLTGGIPASLGDCSDLRTIGLGFNVLTGPIPHALSNLSKLQFLGLTRNQIGGGIPAWLGNLTSITVLSLPDNSFVGSIPSAIGNLISLEFFAVELNNLTGAIPSSIYNLSSLDTLDVGGNRLSGTLPSNIGVSLPKLQVLSLYDNLFHGFIPSSISNASALEVVQLNSNKFRGTVPSKLGTLQGLSWLLLYENQLEARDGDGWSFLTSLVNCTRLEYLSLAVNRLEGVLPPAISNLSTSLSKLHLDGNRISGSIPEDIGNLVGLTTLALGDNLLHGPIPKAIGKLQNMVALDLSGNQFIDQIPSPLSNLTQLNQLYVAENRLRGSIPPSFGNLTNLQDLDLSYNQLSGAIPKELVSISSLSIGLALSHNFLSELLPAEVGHLRNLHLLDVSENKLSGEIPSTLGNCELLGILHIQGNDFQGVIPQSFRKLSGLEELDLSRNNLSGKIPEFLENFHSLKYLNLSFNDFDGMVPKEGIFQNVSAVFISGNRKLCGGTSELHLQACYQGKSRGHSGHILLTIIIIVSTIFLCLLLIFLRLILSRYSRRKSSLPTTSLNGVLTRITYSELFKATNGFSPQNLIGAGSFGSVYKASIDPTQPNGKYVAIKVINLQQQRASKGFMVECEALRNIRHRNLLKIVTSCSSIDFNGNDFKALVFEFMPNGSLEQWLHPVANENGEKHLSLIQRLNIAVDVASALAYLHHQSYTTIVHCDLKPSNVLLDNDMTAHVGDFGLARLLGRDVSRTPTSSLALRGTIGYVAPEYGMGCNVSTEGDVFSYGILLLEMITGRKPTDTSLADDLTLHKLVGMVFPKHVMDIVDPILLIEDDDNVNNISQGINNVRQRKKICLVSLARLGLMCSKEPPKERMRMEAVIKEITAIRENFIGAGLHGRGDYSSNPAFMGSTNISFTI